MWYILNINVIALKIIDVCSDPHNSKQKPLCSLLKRDCKLCAILNLPGIASILIPKE